MDLPNYGSLSQMTENNIDINGKILKNERANERTNERQSERIKERANEWSKNSRMKYWARLEKLKKARYSGTTGCSGNFSKILGIAINNILCFKEQKNHHNWDQRKSGKNGDFRHISVFISWNKKSSEIRLGHILSDFRYFQFASMCSKIRRN